MEKKLLLTAKVFLLSFLLTLSGCDSLTNSDNNGESGSADEMARWFNGTNTPQASVGENGDLFFNTDNGNVYVKHENAWTSMGTVKQSLEWKGTRTDAPENPQENWAYHNSQDGVSYIWDDDSWQVLSRDGTDGDPGPQWFVGTDSPPADDGTDGDYYLDTNVGTVYEKVDGAWQAGDTINSSGWQTGTGAPSTTPEASGSMYLQLDTREIYLSNDRNWTLIGRLSATDDSDNDWATTVRQTSDSVYMIALYDELNDEAILIGTGFAVSPTRIATNAHVYLGLLSHYIIYSQVGADLQPVAIRNGTTYGDPSTRNLSNAVLHEDYDSSTVYSNDVAFFTVDTMQESTIVRADQETLLNLEAGQRIGTMGFPGETSDRLTGFANSTFKDGTISSLFPMDSSLRPSPENSLMIQHNFDTTPGTSGSPILNYNSELVAVNNSGAVQWIWNDATGSFESITVGSIGYGVRGDVLNELLTEDTHIEDDLESWYIPGNYRYSAGSGFSRSGYASVSLGDSASTVVSNSNAIFEKSEPDSSPLDGYVYTDGVSYLVSMVFDTGQLVGVGIYDHDSNIYLPSFVDLNGVRIGSSRAFVLDSYGYNFEVRDKTSSKEYWYWEQGIVFTFDFDGDWYLDDIFIFEPSTITASSSGMNTMIEQAERSRNAVEEVADTANPLDDTGFRIIKEMR